MFVCVYVKYLNMFKTKEEKHHKMFVDVGVFKILFILERKPFFIFLKC